MERLFARTKAFMAKDIEKDDLEVNSLGVSFSAVETKSNFKIVSMRSNALRISVTYLWRAGLLFAV